MSTADMVTAYGTLILKIFMRLCLTYGSTSFPFIIQKMTFFSVKACNQRQQDKYYTFRQDDVYDNGAESRCSSSDTRGLLSRLTEVSRRGQSAALCAVCLCCDSAVMSVRRIMHWARRIEQEIDRVFQHITGAQQLKGVSVCLSFYSARVLLTTARCVNSVSECISGGVRDAKQVARVCSRVTAHNYSHFFFFFFTLLTPESSQKQGTQCFSCLSSGRHKTGIAFLRLSPARLCFFFFLFSHPWFLICHDYRLRTLLNCK